MHERLFSLCAIAMLAVATSSILLCSKPARAGAVEDAIESRVDLIEDGRVTSVGGVALSGAGFVAELYRLREFRPIWTTPGFRTELFEEVSEAQGHGFRPKDFSVDALEVLAAEAGTGDPTAIAAFDIAATEVAARILHHLYYGKVDPRSIFADWSFDGSFQPGQPATMVNQYLDYASFSALVDDLELFHPVYDGMRDALAELKLTAARGGWPRVPDGMVLKPGIEDPSVPVLRRRLLASGDFVGAVTEELRYDSDLETAVKAFQRRHGLDPDGVIGAKTFQELNRTVDERIDQMRVSLERARWTLRGLGDDFVFVNIAGAETYLVRDNAIIWRTRSVVGQSYRMTPLFQDAIRYVEINPTWTVPRTIFLKDKLPRIRKDISYLARGRYSVVDRNRKPLDPYAIDWNAANPPVTLVQAPGAGNALGLIKFMFPNEHAVYLHDTNDRGLFARSERDLSSGCVRVEHPFVLADLLLSGAPGWSPEVRDGYVSAGRTTRIDLVRPMPIVLNYFTAWRDAAGTLQFREDIYRRDPAVLAALNAEPMPRSVGPR